MPELRQLTFKKSLKNMNMSLFFFLFSPLYASIVHVLGTALITEQLIFSTELQM